MRFIIYISLLGTAITLFFILHAQSHTQNNSTTAPTSVEPAVVNTTASTTLPTEDTLTLHEKIGQLLMIGYWGSDSNTALLPLIEDKFAMLVVLLSDNTLEKMS